MIAILAGMAALAWAYIIIGAGFAIWGDIQRSMAMKAAKLLGRPDELKVPRQKFFMMNLMLWPFLVERIYRMWREGKR